MTAEGLLHEPIMIEELWVEGRGKVRLLVELFPLVIEVKVEPIANEVEGLLGILLIAQQRLAVLDLDHPWRVVVSLDPRLQERWHLLPLLGVLVVEAGVVIKILGAWDELFKGLRAVAGQGKRFGEADVSGRSRDKRGSKHQGQGRNSDAELHGKVLEKR